MDPTGKTALDIPIVRCKDKTAWESWLATHHSHSTGLWLRIAKSSSKLQSVSYQEAVEIALCYGWIDGQSKSLDSDAWLQKFTPRGSRSIWSKINRAKAEKLTEQGRMHEPGLAAIENAKANGRWEAAYDSHKTAVPSKEFANALKANPKAKAFYESLNSQNRYAILFRLQNVKKEETRTRKIAKFIEMLEKHQKLYP